MTSITLARVLVTIGWFALFVAISISAWRGRRQEDYAAVARLPLEDSEHVPGLPEERP